MYFNSDRVGVFMRCALVSTLYWCGLSSKDIQAPYDLAVVGMVCFADGIGRQAIGLIDCLKDDLSIKFVHTRKAKELQLQDVPEGVKEIILSRRPGKSNVAIFEDVLSNGNSKAPEYYFKKMPPATIKIAYTMFESTAIPDEWVDILNNHFDAAVVPDEFLVSVYKNSGVTIPIFVIPLGIYIQEFLDQPIVHKTHTPFTLGFSGSFTDRKNHIKVLEGFARAFGNSSKVKLRLHGRSGEANYDMLVERIAQLGLTNVELIRSSYRWQEYLEFMQSLDAYISCATGEGFAVPPREALALGIPCILSSHTAHKTICDSGLVLPIPATISKPAYYNHLDQYIGCDFDCDTQDVAHAMVKMVYDYQHYSSLREAGREWARGYLYQHLKPKYLTLVKPKKVVLGNKNCVSNGTLTTDSPALYAKYLSILPVMQDTYGHETYEQPENLNEHMNQSGLYASDQDLIGAYRVMTGHELPEYDFQHFKKLKDAYKWSLTDLAHHFLAMIQVQDHLKIPSLDSVVDFPIALRNGMTLFGYESDLFIAHTINRTGYWEPELEAVIRALVRPGAVALDIGANIGYFTAILAECVGSSGKVISIEALNPLARLIEKSKQYNNWHQVTIKNVALSNEQGSAYFLVNSINPGGSCIVSPSEAEVKQRIRPKSIITVPTSSLDDLIHDSKMIDRVDYIKIDVEGAEWLVLQGARKILERYKPIITMEFSPMRYRLQGQDPINVLRYLENLGYHYVTTTDLQGVEHIQDHIASHHRSALELVSFIEKNGLDHVDLVLVNTTTYAKE